MTISNEALGAYYLHRESKEHTIFYLVQGNWGLVYHEH